MVNSAAPLWQIHCSDRYDGIAVWRQDSGGAGTLFPWHAVCADAAGDRVKGEEKCQDAARLGLRSARATSTRSIRKPLKAQD
jgi:hypothetical protein